MVIHPRAFCTRRSHRPVRTGGWDGSASAWGAGLGAGLLALVVFGLGVGSGWASGPFQPQDVRALAGRAGSSGQTTPLPWLSSMLTRVNGFLLISPTSPRPISTASANE